jgi:putative transposase
MRIGAYIGTSGWYYDHWKGPFYPSGLSDEAFLKYYAGCFGTAEVNNSFYEGWGEKASRFSGEDESPTTRIANNVLSPLPVCYTVFMTAGYRHNRGSVVTLKYHLIWSPRRRRKVLVGAVAHRLEALLREKAKELCVEIEHLAIRPDHLHMFVNAPPSLAVSQLVYRFKSHTSRVLRQEFAHLQKMPSMWTTAYFASTAGRVSEATIHNYIEAQSTRA